MFLVDLGVISRNLRYSRVRVDLDRIIHDDQELAAHLESTFTKSVKNVSIRSVDMVRDTMTLDVVFQSLG